MGSFNRSSGCTRTSEEEELPQVSVMPPTPTTTITQPISFIRRLSLRRGFLTDNIDVMEHSQSAPSDSNIDNNFTYPNRPITRKSRSQSVPLSLDAVRITRKLVDISDKFNQGHAKVGRTRSYDSETNKQLNKRHSANELLESDKEGSYENIGSPV